MAAVGGLLVEGNLGKICWLRASLGGNLLFKGNQGGNFQSLFLAISDLSRQDAHLVYEEHPAPVDATVLYKIS